MKTEGAEKTVRVFVPVSVSVSMPVPFLAVQPAQ
jgi:hypothetical protein